MGAQRLDTSVLPTDHPKLGGGEEGSAEALQVKGQAAVAGGEGKVLGRLPHAIGIHHSRSCISTRAAGFASA